MIVEFLEEKDKRMQAFMSIDGVVCILSSVHYMVDGSVVVRGGLNKGVRFEFETGAGLNFIRRDALPYSSENHVHEGVAPPKLCDVSGRTLDLREVLWLTTRFGNTVFRSQYIFEERLSVHAIIGTAFLNSDVVFIRCKDQQIEFPRCKVAIVFQADPKEGQGEERRTGF